MMPVNGLEPEPALGSVGRLPRGLRRPRRQVRACEARAMPHRAVFTCAVGMWYAHW